MPHWGLSHSAEAGVDSSGVDGRALRAGTTLTDPMIYVALVATVAPPELSTSYTMAGRRNATIPQHCTRSNPSTTAPCRCVGMLLACVRPGARPIIIDSAARMVAMGDAPRGLRHLGGGRTMLIELEGVTKTYGKVQAL